MTKKIVLLGILLLMLNGCTPTEVDPHAIHYDFQQVVEATGIDKLKLINGLETNFKDKFDLYLRGENYLILGRIKGETSYINVAKDYFSKAAERTKGEEKALLYETLASLLDSKYYHARAAFEWKKLKNDFRYQLNKNLALEKDPKLKFETSGLPYTQITLDGLPKKIRIGSSKITLSEQDILVSQTDRVTRDWLSSQIQNPNSENLLSLFSEALSYPPEELMPEIGWHEGGRIREMKIISDFKHKIATGTIVAKKDGKWYAPNEKGIFMFEVPMDKINYPTLRPFNEKIAMIIDTHGINMIVKQAIESKATIVMGCCDHPGKIKAAKYLSDKGIAVICNTDKYVPSLIGSGANVLGSAPFQKIDGQLEIGNRPLEFSIDKPIVVSNVDSNAYASWYYETPSFYFKELQERTNLKLNVHEVKLTDFNQMNKVIEKAEEVKANLIGVRIFNKNDYENVKQWLEKDINRKAILFHSEAYPYGYKLAREFDAQTSFDDINPVIA